MNHTIGDKELTLEEQIEHQRWLAWSERKKLEDLEKQKKERDNE